MKRLIASLLSVLFMVGLALPASATLTNANTNTTYPNQLFTIQSYTALITATGNDTTTNADSNVIINTGGDVRDIATGVKATNQTGTSPTLTVSFLGSFDNATWFALKTAQGGTAGTVGTLASSALDINTASTTNVSIGISLAQFGYTSGALLPPYLKVRIAVGGSSTPGWTGVAYATVKRQSK